MKRERETTSLQAKEKSEQSMPTPNSGAPSRFEFTDLGKVLERTHQRRIRGRNLGLKALSNPRELLEEDGA